MLNEKNKDKTIIRDYVSRMKRLVNEYELTKQGKHPRFRFVTDFYNANNLKRQNIIKYYHRYINNPIDYSLLPAKRGPKYSTRRTIRFIEKKVTQLREKGANRYEISEILKEELGKFAPTPSTVYNILKRYNLNILKPKQKENKRKIVKNKIGELAHIDCHYLPKGIIMNNNDRLYVVGIIDDYSRIAWCEIVDNIQSLNVMFSLMHLFRQLKHSYGIEFKEVMTDNGPEFGGNNSKEENNQMTNPVKRLFYEMGVKHRRIKPYRPQTNGKIERFWRTFEEDFIEETVFETRKELDDELFKYMVYYNEYRPHQGLNGKKPVDYVEKQ